MARTSNPYGRILDRLTLPEKARLFAHARSRGFLITYLEAEVEGVEVVPLKVIPASEITEAHFPSSTSSEQLERLQRYYSMVEGRELDAYPPLSYTPSLRVEERTAATLVNHMISAAEQDSSQIARANYPLAPILRAKSEAKSSVNRPEVSSKQANRSSVRVETAEISGKSWLSRLTSRLR